MTPQEFSSLPRPRAQVQRVAVDEMMDEDAERTLLWGYDCDRNSWHVYQSDRLIWLVVYDHDGGVITWEAEWAVPVESLIPNKRLYPEACNAEFCELLLSKGAFLPFTTFDATRADRKFHGRILVDGVLSAREPIVRSA